MRKVFMKFRISRVIPTFNSCCSKSTSSLPTNPIPSSFNRHVSSCCLLPPPPSSPEPCHTQSSHFFNWLKRPKHPQCHFNNYHSTPPRRKIYNSPYSDTDHDNNDVVLLPPIKRRVSNLKRRRKRRTFQKVRLSTTSSDSGLFSDDDQTETLVSTDSTTPVKKSKERENRKRIPSFESGNTSPSPAPARLSEFMRKMTPCKAEIDGKVRESFAVVKKSNDPYEDFKTSMAEMVVEKQMFEERELEELLRCFLSLNSQRHHEVIVRAFTEIWKGLFCHSPLSSTE